MPASNPFDVRPGEGGPLILLILQAFFLGLAFVLFETPANTLYLTHFGPWDLPLVYLLTALLSAVSGLVYTHLEKRISPTHLFRWTASGLSFTIVSFFLAQSFSPTTWLPMAMMAWKEVLWVFSNLVLWSVAGMLYDSRQSKRLFGFIASGQVLATIFGGLAIPLLVGRFGTESLFLFSSLSGLVWLNLLTRQLHDAGKASSGPDRVEDEDHEEGSLPTLARDPYVFLLLLSGVASFTSYYLVDYLFFTQVHAAFTEKAALATFFGEFYATLGVVNLLTSVLLSGPLLTRFGLGTGVMMLPGLTGLGALTSLVGGSRFFSALLITKLGDETLRNSVERSTLRILLQPLSRAHRLRVQTWRESLVAPVTVGFAALLLLFLTRILRVPGEAILGILFAVQILWMGINRLLRGLYTQRLTRALQRRTLPLEELDSGNTALLELLDQGLLSRQDADVIYSLTLMERMNLPFLPDLFETHLKHPSPRVQGHVLKRIEALECRALIPALERALSQGPEPSLEGKILRTLCSLLSEEGVERIAPALEAPHPEVRKGAMVGLLRSGGIDGVLLAGRRLQDLAGSSSIPDRILAAKTLGEVGQSHFFRPLLPLLDDPNQEVRRAALHASALLGSVHLTLPVLRNLSLPGLGDAACAALTRIGASALPALQKALKESDPHGMSCRRILGVLGRLPGPACQELLLPFLRSPTPSTRHRALRALIESRFHLPLGKQLEALLDQEIQEAGWNHAAQLALIDEEDCQGVRFSLLAEARRRQERTLLLLTLAFPGGPVRKLLPRITSSSPEQRAYGLEVLDDLLTPSLRGLCFPLLDDLSLRDRLKRFPKAPVPSSRSPQEWLQVFIEANLPHLGLGCWTRATAMRAAVCRKETSLVPSLLAALEDPLPFLRETALASLATLSPGEASREAEVLLHDPAPDVSLLARSLLEEEADT
jgi:HEAT repeat protein